MKFEDILILAKAGFTAEQISKISQLHQLSQPVQPVQPVQPAQPVQPVQPVQPENDFAAQLARLTAAIQANGILGSAQPKQETAEDILASIINPPVKEEK